ncbi:Zinc transporter 2 [Plakobranchus ocellatus]|uniref:Zinc transporter 2 n=1 Tax=Plakobranchus ocellatus TaxID=259542 RepID=A0AAV3ZHF7_9GAST|nr:Zinc transporter 2 [Plakobranchus ocellatus]
MRALRCIDDRRMPPMRVLRCIDDRRMPPMRALRRIDDRRMPPMRALRCIDDRRMPPMRVLRCIDDRRMPPIRALRRIDDRRMPPLRALRCIDDRRMPPTRALRESTYFYPLLLLESSQLSFTQEDPRFRLADPICTFLFSLLVLVTTVTVLRDTLLVMMEAVPRDLSLEGLKQDLRSIDGVVALHDLHVWALTLDRNALSVHLAIENPNAHVQVLSMALTVAQDQHGFFSSTIQVEMFDEEKARECSECSEP